MNLDEFKAYVQAKQNASTMEALKKLTETKEFISATDLFDQDDLLTLDWSE